LEENKKDHYKVDVERDRSIINVLGEVCWGFQVDDFEKTIGVKEQIAETLLEKLLRMEKSGIHEIYLNSSEIEIIRNAFKKVAKEIEEWEFEARLGVSLKEMKNISIFKDCG
jgi:hypothetical protein